LGEKTTHSKEFSGRSPERLKGGHPGGKGGEEPLEEEEKVLVVLEGRGRRGGHRMRPEKGGGDASVLSRELDLKVMAGSVKGKDNRVHNGNRRAEDRLTIAQRGKHVRKKEVKHISYRGMGNRGVKSGWRRGLGEFGDVKPLKEGSKELSNQSLRD